MQISFSNAALKSKWNLLVLATFALASCAPTPDLPPTVKVDKPFAAGGRVEMQLTGGDYSIRAASDDRVRVSFAGNPGNASAEMSVSGTRANLAINDTPHNNFRATIEVPANAELNVHLAAGNLEVAGVTGSKDIESQAGNVGISIPNPNDYGTVDASVKVGNLGAGPFGGSDSGVSNHLKKSGPGKYTLRASLGAGNLQLKP